MKYAMIKAILFTVTAFFIVAAPFLSYPESIASVSSGNYSENNIILLDAGHGGEDGGAIGFGGIIEKDLNLSITLKTAKFLEFLGYVVEFTRETDRMTCDENLENQRERKVSDIKNRLEQMEKSPCLCVISIHQNFFGGDAKGAQIFYSGNNPESKALAKSLQSGITSMLQPENNRVIKQSTKDIYILYHTNKPAVLVECGFISNAKEEAQLRSPEYQKKLCAVIAASVSSYLYGA